MGLDIYTSIIVGRKIDKQLIEVLVPLLDEENSLYLEQNPTDFFKEVTELEIEGEEFTIDYDYDEEKPLYFGINQSPGWWKDRELSLVEVTAAMEKFTRIIGLPCSLYISPRISI